MTDIEQKAIEAAAQVLFKYKEPSGLWGFERTLMRARAAIAAYEAAMWQPIKTAPRDASWFLAGHETTYDIVGSNTFWSATARFEYDYDTQPEMMMPDGCYGPTIDATHWRPLPLPPENKP